MIHGDIDLTENLDFYKDRKSLEYKNSRDFSLSINKNKDPDYIDLIYNATQSLSLTATYSNTTTYRWNINNLSSSIPIDDSYNQNARYVNWQLNNLITTVTNTHSYDEYNYNTWTNDINIVANDDDLIYHKVITVKQSVCKKIFGDKHKCEHMREHIWYTDPLRLLFSLFEKRYDKVYRNSRDFENHKSGSSWNDTTSYSKIRNTYLSWTGSYYDWIDRDNSATILFNSREDHSSKYEEGVPWLNDLKRSNKQAYDNYIEDLNNEDKDYSSYLTNYGWLRMR